MNNNHIYIFSEKIKKVITRWEDGGSDGECLDDILDICKVSKIHLGYELHDIIMKIDGEYFPDDACIELANAITRRAVANKGYHDIFPNVDFRQNANEWNERYQPIQGSDDVERIFDTCEPDTRQATDIARKLSDEQGTNICQHIWTIVDGYSGKLILINGWRKVNRLGYIVCKNPWGNGPKHDNVYIESKYEEGIKNKREVLNGQK